jgi:hypothetical protein
MALILLLVFSVEKQIGDQPIFLDGKKDPYASDYLFIGTSYGIYTFDRQSERWSRITQASGLPENTSTILGLDEGILWVVTPSGLASADVKINDWQIYGQTDSITDMAFDDEYVWISSHRGIQRFDKYIEIWETIAEMPTADIAATGDYIWCASDSGIFRFDQTYEKFERAPGAPTAAFRYILETPQRLWFFGQTTLAALEKETERWSSYPGFVLEDIAPIGDSLFAVAGSSVVLFDPGTDTWNPYKDLSEISNISGISTSGSDVFLATERGLMIYSMDDRTSTSYTQAHGLHVEQLIDVYPVNDYIFVASTAGLEYLNPRTDIWSTEIFTPAPPARQQIFYIDDAGAHARLLPGVDTRLQGRTYRQRTWEPSDDRPWYEADYENVNLKLINTHASGRLLSVYYDDTDPDQLMYGYGYRGLERDFLYRTNGGILGTEYYEFDLVPSFSYLGANLKMRSQNHSIDAQGGYLKSRVHTDFFTGTSFNKEFSLQDIDFATYFYYIFNGPQLITATWDTVFVDDRNAMNNSIDTRVGHTLAGITGDYDVLVNGIDYYIDYSRGVIRFLQTRNSSDIIVLVLDGSEIIIQSGAVTDHMLENVYFLAPDILPHSLRISITDTSGVIYPLSTFGLDQDADDMVDAAFIDYHLGYLTFPDERPFPDEVYDMGIHIFTLEVRCASRANIYHLSNTPVVKMSETVYVDGDDAARGSDYIVDYTSGALIFLTEGLVNDFSEIEVQYSSVERDREDVFYTVQPNVSLGSITVAPGFSSIDEQDIAHLSAKLDAGSAGKNLQFVPQAAYTTDQEWAHDYSVLANYHMVSLSAAYRGLSDSFDIHGANTRKWGRLRHQGSMSARIEPLRYLQCETSLRKEIMNDSLDNELSAQYLQGSISYANPGFPNGSIRLGMHQLPDKEKNTQQAKMNYTLQVLKARLKLNAVAGHVSVMPDTGNDADEYEFITSGSLVLPMPINGTWYYRKSDVYENDTVTTRIDELRGNMGVDIIPGLYYTSSYLAEAESYILPAEQDLMIQHYFYNNLNIAPGRWLRPLSVINLMCGIGSIFDQYVSGLPLGYNRSWFLLAPVTDGSVSRINETDTYYLSVRLNPWTELVLWGKHTISENKAATYAIPEPVLTQRDEVRVEFEPQRLGFFSLYWDRKLFRTYPEKTTDNLFAEWIKSWTVRLRTRFTANYYTTEDLYGQVSTSSNELRSNFQTLVRFGARSYITFDIGGSRKEDMMGEIVYAIIPGAGFDINLYTGIYVQCNYEANALLDSITTHLVTARITGQF